MHAASRRPAGPCLLHAFLALTLTAQGVAGAFDFGKADDAYGFYETFDIARDQKPLPYRLTLIESSAAGNVFHPKDTTVFTFQIENLTDEPFRVTGKVDAVHYGGRGRPGEMWVPEFYRIDDVGSVPIHVSRSSLSVSPSVSAGSATGSVSLAYS